MTRSEELDAISKVLNGDKDAFEALVTENQSLIYNLTLKMTANEQDALDLTQEAFLKAYSSLSSFRGSSKFSVWMYRLTYNLCLDFLRKKKHDAVISLTQGYSDSDSEDIEIADERYSPETELSKKEVYRSVSDALSTLPDDQRQIFIMREYSGMTYDRISETLNLSIGTVKSRLSRARQKIAKHLVKCGTFGGLDRLNDRKEEKEYE